MAISNVITNIEQLIPKFKQSEVYTSLDRITQPFTDFFRANPIVSTALIGAGTTGLVTGAAIIRKRKKSTKTKKKTTRRKTTRKTKRKIARKRTRRTTKRGRKRIIRGRGLGYGEIRHSGKGTKGKYKLVKFRNKKTGKMVTFKARR